MAATEEISHPQDWLLILEALVYWAGPDPVTTRQRRAWELAGAISEAQGLRLEDAVLQTDRNYDGPPRQPE